MAWVPLVVGVAGAVGGAAMSYSGGKKQRDYVNDRQMNAPPINGVSLGDWRAQGEDMAAGNRIDTTQQKQFRDAQVGLMGQLQEASQGRGPSAAQALLIRANEENAARARSIAQGASGVNAGLAMRNEMQTASQGNIANAQQASILRAQEQQSAMQQLGALSSNARAQDINLAQTQADLTQKYINMGLTAADAQMRANLEIEKMKQQVYMQNTAIAAGYQGGGLTQLGSGMMGLSSGLANTGSSGYASSGGQQTDTSTLRSDGQPGESFEV